MKLLSLTVGAGLCAVSFFTPAIAQVAERQIIATTSVRHGDLDLSSDAGASTMLARLDVATTKVCGGKRAATLSGGQLEFAKRREHRRCKAAAMESSTLKLGSKVRTAWLDQRAAELAQTSRLPGPRAR